ncbi:MAG: translation elongation factor Ts [Gemmatimonadetes bacterium]|nr:translation elongation factor Ts [Gemmatimonadota bacterium]
MAITASAVKELRERTGAGMMDCKRALEEVNGDVEAAIDLLRARGAAKAAKRAGREAREGRMGSYVHFGGRIAVLVEVNCETDFVAKTEDFGHLVRDLAMHIAAASPLAVAPADIAPEIVERERQIYLEQARAEGKPEPVQQRIVEGKLKKFFSEHALLEQSFVKDPDRTVRDVVTEVAAKTGENIVVRRFVRFELGGA